MRAGMIFSVILHLTMIFVVFFGLPSFFAKRATEEHAIIVEILPISEVTNVKPKQHRVKPQEKPKQEVTSAEKPKPALPDPTVKPKPVEEPKINVTKKPKPEAKVATLEAKPVIKPKPQEKKPEPKPVKKQEEKPEDLFGAVLNTIEELDVKEAPKKEKEIDFSDIEDMLASNDNQPEFMPGLPLSMSEKDAIIKQISDNWSFSGGGKDVHKMIITLRIALAQDGTVRDVDIVDDLRYNTDRAFQALADSAVRAVHKSSPLKNLPIEKYAVKDGWRDMEINFDPSEMLY